MVGSISGEQLKLALSAINKVKVRGKAWQSPVTIFQFSTSLVVVLQSSGVGWPALPLAHTSQSLQQAARCLLPGASARSHQAFCYGFWDLLAAVCATQ